MEFKRCPNCKLNWTLAPPAKIQDGKGNETGDVRCVDCKTVFPAPNKLTPEEFAHAYMALVHWREHRYDGFMVGPEKIQAHEETMNNIINKVAAWMDGEGNVHEELDRITGENAERPTTS